MMKKVIVEVITKTDTAGQVWPLCIVWEDGRKFEIDRVISSKSAASLKVGGQGMRYTIQVNSKDTYLFHDGEGYWFVEGK